VLVIVLETRALLASGTVVTLVPFSIQIFVVVGRLLRARKQDNSRAKIHSHSTINKKVFSRQDNMLDNLSGNLSQFFFLS